MTIYILQSMWKGVAEAPRVFDTERKAKSFKARMEKVSDSYNIEIFAVEMIMKMKSFHLIGG